MLNNLSDIQKEELIEHYKSGVKITQLMLLYNTKNRHGILNYLRSRGVEIRQDQKTAVKKYCLNENIFDIVDNPEKAYWLGFLYADGYNSVNKGGIRVILSNKDISHLEKLRNFLSSNAPIKTKKGGGSYNPNGLYSTLDIHSKKLSNALNIIGCKQNKSLTLTFPTINKLLIPHFIRGYFDGDGSVYLNNVTENKYHWQTIRISICGTYEFLKSLSTELNITENNLCVYKEKRRVSNTWKYQVAGNKRIKLFYDYIYKDATVFLHRKKEIFNNFYGRRSETIISHPNIG
jgi:hypothetical protein